jgi:hypothetical protein
MSVFKKMIRRVKDFLYYQLPALIDVSKLLPGFIKGRISQLFKTLPKNAKNIFFILEDQKLWDGADGNSRYIYLILTRFSKAGYNVYFYRNMDLRTYKRLGNDGKLMFEIKNLKIVNKLPLDTSDMICAFDIINEGVLKKKWKSLVYVNTFKPPFCQTGNVIWIPYFMYARNYSTGQDNAVNLYRRNKRKIKMLFAGNTDAQYYNSRRIKVNYGKMTRIEGVNTLLGVGDRVKCGESRKNFEEIMNIQGYVNDCRILLTNEKFPIKLDEWFRLLSASDFFICLSGTDLPMCHNAIEAMAVGTIPLIGYPEWFFPPLEHKKNAIVYDGKEDLIRKFNEVLNMSPDEIKKMREHVVDYYEQYLSAESFIQKFESQRGQIFTIMLHPRLVCNKEIEGEGQELYDDLYARFGILEKQKNKLDAGEIVI